MAIALLLSLAFLNQWVLSDEQRYQQLGWETETGAILAPPIDAHYRDVIDRLTLYLTHRLDTPPIEIHSLLGPSVRHDGHTCGLTLPYIVSGEFGLGLPTHLYTYVLSADENAPIHIDVNFERLVEACGETPDFAELEHAYTVLILEEPPRRYHARQSLTDSLRDAPADLAEFSATLVTPDHPNYDAGQRSIRVFEATSQWVEEQVSALTTHLELDLRAHSLTGAMAHQDEISCGYTSAVIRNPAEGSELYTSYHSFVFDHTEQAVTFDLSEDGLLAACSNAKDLAELRDFPQLAADDLNRTSVTFDITFEDEIEQAVEDIRMWGGLIEDRVLDRMLEDEFGGASQQR